MLINDADNFLFETRPRLFGEVTKYISNIDRILHTMVIVRIPVTLTVLLQ